MLKIDGKYGSIHINGMNVNIERTKINELNKYLEELETKRMKLIEQQNNYLSEIIK